MASEAPDIIVKFDHVQKSYDGENLVVKDLNLDVERGEFLTMLGPSGSGKTTVLMMLAGFETATHGEIFLNSVPINNVAPHKRGIGMVFQNYALFPHMTVAENLAFPLQVRRMGKPEIEEKVNRALEMVRWGALAVGARLSSRAASSSVWPWRAPWSSSPTWCSWTSLWGRWTRICAKRCSTRSSTSTKTWG